VTFAVWNDSSHSKETNSLNADPKFTVNGSNFTLQPTSPAIHAGDLGQDLGLSAISKSPT